MAITASAVWELRSTATAGNTNGGFFKTGATGSDFSQQDAAQFALTGIASAGAGSTFLTATAAATMVGNGCYIVSGTNFTVGWYEIISVNVGVDVTLDRACTTGVGAAGVINIGGAMSLNSTLDDSLFEAVVGGNTIYVKNGAFSLGQAVSVASVSSTATTPILMIGYNSTRTDDPRGSTRPTINCGTFTFTPGQFWQVKGIIFNSSAANTVVLGTGGALSFCKVANTSASASQIAVNTVSDSSIIGCELVSQNGTAIVSALGLNVTGSYIHDSVTGFLTSTGTGRCTIVDNLFESISGFGLDIALTSTGLYVGNNTFYGAEAKSPGTAIRMGGSAQSVKIVNNIFYGWTTGISQTGTELNSNFGFYNCFNNNTSNTTNYTLDATDVTTNPTFTGASQITGTTGNTSGSVLTQSGGDFSTVTDNVDYLRVVSGTGVTTGIYLITGHTGTTITTNNALGTSSSNNDVYVVTVGHNLQVGTTMKGAGYPGAFGSETTSYTDIGGVQRQEAAGGGGGVF